jgi:hypothetical protein
MKLEEVINQLALATKNSSDNLQSEIKRIVASCGITGDEDDAGWIGDFFEFILERKEIKEQTFQKSKNIDKFYSLITRLIQNEIFHVKSQNFGESMDIEFTDLHVFVYISWEDDLFSIKLLS